jgi:hypothetical protein
MNILPKAGSGLDRLAAGIQKPISPDNQGGGGSPSKGKFRGAMAHPKIGVAEFSYLLD